MNCTALLAAATAFRFEWAALPDGGAPVVLSVLVAVIVFVSAALYRREQPATSGGLRGFCCALRILSLAMVGAILLRPSVALDVERVRPGRVVVLADASASMSVRDEQMAPAVADAWARRLGLASGNDVKRLRRHDVVRELVSADGGGLLAALRRRNDVELLVFGVQAESLLHLPRQPEAVAAEPHGLPEWEPKGAATDLAGALQTALARPGQLASIILLSDGRRTAGAGLQSGVVRAREQTVPVHVVAVGSTLPLRNVAILGLDARDRTVAGLPLEMKAVVQARGYEGRSVRLTLTATEEATDRSHEVASRTLTLAGGGQQVVELTHVPPAAGELLYRVALEPLTGESRTDDNGARCSVTVAEEKAAVLIVAGGPSREFRFLRALLNREPTWEPTIRVHDAAPPVGGPLPRTREELSIYSAVVLCDPAPGDMTDKWLDMLAELVEREGLGVVYIAGPAYSPELLSGRARGKLQDMLPVSVDMGRARAMIGSPDVATQGWPVVLAEEGADHSIIGPGSGLSAVDFWRGQPGLYWALPTGRAKPGATILLRWANPTMRDSSGGDPILSAVHSYGLGRVFFCASPETWRWRQRGIAHYDRFWLQVVRYCAGGRLAGGAARTRISTDRATYAPGQPINVRATVHDERFRPLADDAVELDVILDTGRESARLTHTGAAGSYSGIYYPKQLGGIEFAYTSPGGQRTVRAVEVRAPDVEFEDTSMDLLAMQQLAQATGGRVFGPDDVDRLPDTIPDLTRYAVERGPLRPLWDRAYVLVVLLVTLATEWVLRRRMGLL